MRPCATDGPTLPPLSWRWPLLLVALLTVAGSDPAAAQLGRKSWEFYPHVGPFFPGDPDFLEGEPGFEGLNGGVLWGVYATYHYTDHVGVELGFSKATANHTDAAIQLGGGEPVLVFGDVSFDFWELNGFVNSGALNKTQFFATAGGGLVNYDREGGGGVTRLLLDGGVGLRYYAWKNIALRGEVKDFIFVDPAPSDYRRALDDDTIDSSADEETLHNFGVLAGITFNF